MVRAVKWKGRKKTQIAKSDPIRQKNKLLKIKDGSIASLATTSTTSEEPLSEYQRQSLRVVGQYLKDLGLKSTVQELARESGCEIERLESGQFKEAIDQLDWPRALKLLNACRNDLDYDAFIVTKVLLIEERVKGELAVQNAARALRILRKDYPSDKRFTDRRQFFSTLIFKGPAEIARHFSPLNMRESARGVINVLNNILPSKVWLQSGRLNTLLHQAAKYQSRVCKLHVAEEVTDFLINDHDCSKGGKFPEICRQEIDNDGVSIFCVEFSKNGKFLASGGNSECIRVFSVDTESFTLKEIHKLPIRRDTQVCCLSWSHDSRFLAAAAQERSNCGIFLFDLRSGGLQMVQPYRTESFTSVSFFPVRDSYLFACGDELGNFQQHDARRPTTKPKRFAGFRIRGMQALSNGSTVLAFDTRNRIRSYCFGETRDEVTLIQETENIMHFAVSPDEERCIVSTATKGIRMWSLQTMALLKTFHGAIIVDQIIVCTFGGTPRGDFIASGSEDGTLYIWNTRHSKPIRRLRVEHRERESLCAIAWNPAYPQMIVTGDTMISVWAPSEIV